MEIDRSPQHIDFNSLFHCEPQTLVFWLAGVQTCQNRSVQILQNSRTSEKNLLTVVVRLLFYKFFVCKAVYLIVPLREIPD